MPEEPEVYITLVNWNGWSDTIECLLSLFRLDYTNFHIIIVDNGSSDGSVEKIRLWADGKLETPVIGKSPLKNNTQTSLDMPITHSFVNAANSEFSVEKIETEHRMTLIASPQNLGFAGGNNLAFRYLDSIEADFDFVWLLNNDTVVPRDSIRLLVRVLAEKPQMGIAGSQIRYYDSPETIQLIGGGWFNKWFALTGHCTEFEKADKLDYICGASMLASREFIRRVGLMDEEYFLYYEDVDWSLRAKSGGFSLGVAENSIVFHKQGASIGSSDRNKSKSLFSDFYTIRNRLLITRKHNPGKLPYVYLSICYSFLKRLLKGNFGAAFQIVRIILNKRYQPKT